MNAKHKPLRAGLSSEVPAEPQPTCRDCAYTNPRGCFATPDFPRCFRARYPAVVEPEAPAKAAKPKRRRPT